MRAHSIPRKYMLLASAVAALSAGCTSMPRDGERPQSQPLGAEYKTIGRPPGAVVAAMGETNLTRTGSVTLEQALALALMRSPELESFSHAVLAAEARFAQSKRLPNPQVEVGISEFDRGGEGFDTAETEVVLGQRIELGGFAVGTLTKRPLTRHVTEAIANSRIQRHVLRCAAIDTARSTRRVGVGRQPLRVFRRGVV